MIPSALAWDWALRMKVKVMLRASGLPLPQAPTISVAASTAAVFQIRVRFAMAHSLPCRHRLWEEFAMVGCEKA
ncbi:hypothetical protein MBOU_08430 [Mycobacterium bourgelatii]|uniref:Uncharacterized protein n=1 Tax=Mycobacterium bourgelatii TaxID=1273442 RepID=A0A7I9YJD8_MYCBU|nr:hypothetical protein MBOU_08430 [Mycobacterium bourgelatii]